MHTSLPRILAGFMISSALLAGCASAPTKAGATGLSRNIA